MTARVRPLDVRASIVDTFRRDLVGPGPQDADLARERLSDNPSRCSDVTPIRSTLRWLLI